MNEKLHKKVSPPFEAYLYTHLFINTVQKELNLKIITKIGDCLRRARPVGG
jgi:hypothetical protein